MSDLLLLVELILSPEDLRNTVKDSAVETGQDLIPESVNYALAAFDDLNARYEEYLSVEKKGWWARRISVFVLLIAFTSVILVGVL